MRGETLFAQLSASVADARTPINPHYAKTSLLLWLFIVAVLAQRQQQNTKRAETKSIFLLKKNKFAFC